MHAAYFVGEREVTCSLIETKGPTAAATIYSLQESVRPNLIPCYVRDSEPI